MRGDARYHLAILADLRGDLDEADELYVRAYELDPDFLPPVRMSDDDAEQVLLETIGALPGELRHLEDPAIQMRAVPDHAVDRVGPLTLGLFVGNSLASESSRLMPEYILVFKRNVERAAVDADDLREQLRIT